MIEIADRREFHIEFLKGEVWSQTKDNSQVNEQSKSSNH
ncbi:hypothetical protein SIPHO068v1_p0077 [Vibrio phage 51E28.4]|nr:hypothetical protein SIPHO068v1_p0077 [Vibrio phage 51E28.4]